MHLITCDLQVWISISSGSSNTLTPPRKLNFQIMDDPVTLVTGNQLIIIIIGKCKVFQKNTTGWDKIGDSCEL